MLPTSSPYKHLAKQIDIPSRDCRTVYPTNEVPAITQKVTILPSHPGLETAHRFL